jgi:4'-phosphopantetheinyl transferase
MTGFAHRAVAAGLRPAPTVRVWQLDLADPGWDVDSAAGSLTASERRRAEQGLPEVRRRRILLRAALRLVLGAHLGVAPARVPLDEAGDRPVLPAAGRRPAPGISCSASGGLGLVAVSDGTPIGIDLEQHRDDDARRALDEEWLADAERAALARLPWPERSVAITRCWTHKEAVLKGEGVGLRRDPASVVTPVAVRGRAGRWSLEPVPVADGFVASLAVGAPVSLPTAVPVIRPTALEARRP